MGGYFGTDHQQALQRRTYEQRHWIAATPGIYNAGRFAGIDDPDRQGWSAMQTMLERDGLLGFRMISPPQASRCFPLLETVGCRIDTWHIFVGEPHDAGDRARAVAARGLPHGIAVLPPLVGAESADTRSVQQFLSGNGMAPFSGALLAARPPAAKTVVLGDESGAITATGHAYFPHNSHSPFHGHAWIGLVAVAQGWRGKGLGRLVNALLIGAAFDELGARCVYEMVAPANEVSRHMVEGCGLSKTSSLCCGVAMLADTARFTR